MSLIVDEEHLGTTEAAWAGSAAIRSLPPLELPPVRRAVLIAPHPDDEVFGAAGLLQLLGGLGTEIVIVGVTDGEASHPETSRLHSDLPRIRNGERRRALARLGLQATVERLRLPDGRVGAQSGLLRQRLEGLVRSGDLCIGPWRSDGHPDHDASGHAMVEVCRSRELPYLEYLVWTWHWAEPANVPWPSEQARVLNMSRVAATRKDWAGRAFTSQVTRSAPGPGGAPVLPGAVLQRFRRSFEVFLQGAP